MKYKIIKLLLISTYCLSLFGCELNIGEIKDKTQNTFFNEINKSLNNNYSKDYLDQFEEVTVDRVIDGDTFVTADDRKVRLVGVNTPESTTKLEEYGEEASLYSKDKLTGKKVYLQKDISEEDIYGRLLRIVWLEIPSSIDDLNEIKSKMFNAHLLIYGYAQPSTYEPDIKYSNIFKFLAAQAKDLGIGLWGISENGTTKGDKME